MQNNTSLCTIMKNCEDVLDTFFKWASQNFSEINIVVDPKNDDNTLRRVLYRSDYFNVKVHPFDDFSSQKQRACDMCTKPYAVLIDSDEILEEIPENGIENFMWRTNADVGVLPRYNFQGDDEHFLHYPDHQFRVIKVSSNVKMNGKPVDERLNTTKDHMLAILPWHILHYGHIREESALKLKGKDRIKFMNDDPCDGQPLLIHGEDWFIKRNELWNKEALSVPKNITEYSRKYFNK